MGGMQGIYSAIAQFVRMMSTAAGETSKQQYHAVTSAHDRTKEWRDCCFDIFMGRDAKRQRFSGSQSGYDESDDDDESDGGDLFFGRSSPDCVAIDLINHGSTFPAKNNQNERAENCDTWMTAALTMSASIDEVSLMIRLKATSYVSSTDTFNICFESGNSTSNNTMTNADRSILETTVASFAAGMAKQIESLRQTVIVEGDHPFMKSSEVENDGNDMVSSHQWATGPIGHRAGITSCLMQRLKSEIMDPMTSLQMEREKSSSKNKSKNDGNASGEEASKFSQNPLRGFRLNVEDTVRRSLPPAPWEADGHHHREHGWTDQERDQEKDDFLNIYFEENTEKEKAAATAASLEKITTHFIPPSSVMKFLDSPKAKTIVTQSNNANESDGRKQQWSKPINQSVPKDSYFPPKAQQLNFDDALLSPYEEEENIEQLHRESAALVATYQHSDLEGVQKVERSMVEITQLLSRFTDLISEQQEDIFKIHDQALKSKDNVDKGQDQLVDAATRGEKSKHPMATFIVFMAFLLLFFNWITP